MFWFPLHWLGGHQTKKNGAGIHLENQSPDELQMLAYATKPNTQFPTEPHRFDEPIPFVIADMPAPKPSWKPYVAKAAAVVFVLGWLGSMEARQHAEMARQREKIERQSIEIEEIKNKLNRSREDVAAEEKKLMEQP